jgi:hypothetical protein
MVPCRFRGSPGMGPCALCGMYWWSRSSQAWSDNGVSKLGSIDQKYRVAEFGLLDDNQWSIGDGWIFSDCLLYLYHHALSIVPNLPELSFSNNQENGCVQNYLVLLSSTLGDVSPPASYLLLIVRVDSGTLGVSHATVSASLGAVLPGAFSYTIRCHLGAVTQYNT